jgi:hypothetical protein
MQYSAYRQQVSCHTYGQHMQYSTDRETHQVLQGTLWLPLPQAGNTPLLEAAVNGNKEVARQLLAAGAAVDASAAVSPPPAG